MFLTVHSTAGIALGSLTGNPLLAFAMGFVSHLVLDIIPHGDEPLGRWAESGNYIKRAAIAMSIDVALAGTFIYVIFGDIVAANPLPLLAGALGAMTPDVMTGVVQTFPSKIYKWFDTFHAANHTLLKNPLPLRYGMGLQILTLTALTYQMLT